MKNLTEAEKNWKNINQTYLYAFCYTSRERVRFSIRYFWENVLAKDISWIDSQHRKGIGCDLMVFLSESERDEYAKQAYDDYDLDQRKRLPLYFQTHCIDAERYGLPRGLGDDSWDIDDARSPRIKVNDVLIEYKTLIAVQGYSSLAKDKDNQHEPTDD
tara:strand:+ start:836 stop:1312 length:477 start_codon:yes stop_codon:yes gene_type:complete